MHHFFRSQLTAFKILLEQVVLAFRRGLHQAVPRFGNRIRQFRRDLPFFHLAAAVGYEEKRLSAQNIRHALEIRAGSDRNLKGDGQRRQYLLRAFERRVEVGALPIHSVDEDEPADTGLLRPVPDLFPSGSVRPLQRE